MAEKKAAVNSMPAQGLLKMRIRIRCNTPRKRDSSQMAGNSAITNKLTIKSKDDLELRNDWSCFSLALSNLCAHSGRGAALFSWPSQPSNGKDNKKRAIASI